MMRPLVLLVALAASAAAARAEPPLPSGTFRIGSTHIMCIKAPCPTVGIVLLKGGAGGRRESWPVYSENVPPRLEGPEAARAAVAEHWSVSGCLIVEGAFLAPAVFEIRRVVEDCRR